MKQAVHKFSNTADFIKKVLSVYTHSKTTIYLSLSAQVVKGTFFMKSPVVKPFYILGPRLVDAWSSVMKSLFLSWIRTAVPGMFFFN